MIPTPQKLNLIAAGFALFILIIGLISNCYPVTIIALIFTSLMLYSLFKHIGEN